MSETILKILLEELETLRLVCKSCKTALEMPVSAFNREHPEKRQREDTRCPGCGAVLRLGVPPDHAPDTDAFDRLAAAWKSLKQVTNFDIGFVIPGEKTGAR